MGKERGRGGGGGGTRKEKRFGKNPVVDTDRRRAVSSSAVTAGTTCW